MRLCFVKSCIVEIPNLIKQTRCLHHMKDYRNVLISSASINKHISLYDLSFKLCNVNEFSTANTLLKIKGQCKKKKEVVHVDPNEIANVVKVDRMMAQFDRAIENYKDQMVKHLSVRTRVGAIEELTVMFEDEQHYLEDLVEISRKPNMIVMDVSSFPQVIPNVLESLRKSQMNLNPQQEGTTIYVPLPKITTEHRESLAKTAKQYFVRCKDIIGDIRNEHVRELKKQDVPTDLIFKAESYIGALQKEYVDKANQLLKVKQKELVGES